MPCKLGLHLGLGDCMKGPMKIELGYMNAGAK